ncbi:MAG TPA: hypothetical protein VHS97_17245 [Isosphaeraceae bacterium]|nr:hypothetical protein [Isosphaeraceae bacterium]
MRPTIRIAASRSAARRLMACGAVITAALWAHLIYTSWRDDGLIQNLGGDFTL